MNCRWTTCLAVDRKKLLSVAEGNSGLRVAGVSFYTGYRGHDTTVDDRLIAADKFVVDSAATQGRHRLELLNTGGGFYTLSARTLNG